MTTQSDHALPPRRRAVFPALHPLAGMCFATARSGTAYVGRDDLLLVRFSAPAVAAGLFTRSTAAAAPVLWSRRALMGGEVRLLLVNAGNANAATGLEGVRAVRAIVAAAAKSCRLPPPRRARGINWNYRHTSANSVSYLRIRACLGGFLLLRHSLLA